MKKSHIFIGTILILFLAAITNPSKEKYISYVKQKSIEKGENFIEKGVYSLVASPVVELSTTEENYTFFTIFETNFGKDTKYTSIGVFNNFFSIDRDTNVNDELDYKRDKTI